MSLWQVSFVAALALAAIIVGPTAAQEPNQDNDARARQFVDYHEAIAVPLEIEAALAFWAANVTGKEEDFRTKQNAEERNDLCLANPKRFAELKSIREGGVSDRLLARQIDILYLGYLAKQVDHDLLKQMLVKSNAAQRAFNVFRPEVAGKN